MKELSRVDKSNTVSDFQLLISRKNVLLYFTFLQNHCFTSIPFKILCKFRYKFDALLKHQINDFQIITCDIIGVDYKEFFKIINLILYFVTYICC